MVYALYKSIFAMMAAIAIGSTDGTGVCYAPWHNPTVTEDILKADISLIGKYFSSFRTFETRMANLNVINVAASVGVKIAVGVQMNDLSKVDAEIQAVCEGYKQNPGIVETVWVGNENLQNGDFGTVSVDKLIGYIKQVKECTGGAVAVGTVQRINEWISVAGVDKIVDESNACGANIYPFFTQGQTTPIEKLKAQWEQIVSKFGGDKFVVTETGWPTDGEQAFGNTPSKETSQQYLNDFVEWSKDKRQEFWFQMFDQTISYTGAKYEKHFGVCNLDGSLKLTVPGIAKSGSDMLTNTTSVPTPDAPQPKTPASSGSPEVSTGDAQADTPLPQTPGSPEASTPDAQADTPSPQTPGSPEASTPDAQADTPSLQTPGSPEVSTPDAQLGTPLTQTPLQEPPMQESSETESSEKESPAAYTPAPTVQSGKDCAI